MQEEKYYDPTENVYLTPSFHGLDCIGNGGHQDVDCCCDECDYYLLCFPDWREFLDSR